MFRLFLLSFPLFIGGLACQQVAKLDLVVGVLLIDRASEYDSLIESALISQLKSTKRLESSIKVYYASDSSEYPTSLNTRVQKQLEQFDKLLDADLIFIEPAADEQIASRVKIAAEQGIELISLSGHLENAFLSISFADEKIGLDAAQRLLKNIKDSRSPASILILNALNNHSFRTRVTAARTLIEAQAPQMQIISSDIPILNNTESSMNLMRALTSLYDIDAVIVFEDRSTIGIARQARQAGKETLVVGVGGSQDLIDELLLPDSAVLGFIALEPQLLARTAVAVYSEMKQRNRIPVNTDIIVDLPLNFPTKSSIFRIASWARTLGERRLNTASYFE